MTEVNKRTYEVEKIMDARKNSNGEWMYLTKWMYYPITENTWEPKESFDNDDAITNFWKDHSIAEFLSPYKQQYLPKESLELGNIDTNSLAEKIYPKVTKDEDIESIVGVAKINGQTIFLVKVINFPKHIKIPSKVLRKICPIKIIKFYESKISQ